MASEARASLWCLSLFVASSAHATSVMQGEIPNLPAACTTCHVEGGGSALNAFGLDAFVTRDRAADAPAVIRWSTLWNVDSDGDGQTNGMELGDPCGEWTLGEAAPRETDISEPGNEDALSGDPLTGCSDGNEPPDAPTPRPEKPSVLDITQTTNTNPLSMFSGGCLGNQVSSQGFASDVAPLVLCAIALRFRARRRR